MMREFKFRGYNGEKWLFGNLDIDYKTKQAAISDDRWWRHPVRFETVGQFTGLKDHKDREIYEGDIVKVVSYGEESFHVVKYMVDEDYPAFDLDPVLNDGECNSLSYSLNALDTKIIVIGNIYDNPEMRRLCNA